MKRFLPFLCCLLFLAGCTAPSADAEPAQVQFFSMDTVMSIRVYNEGGEDAIQAARQEVERLDKLFPAPIRTARSLFSTAMPETAP